MGFRLVFEAQRRSLGSTGMLLTTVRVRAREEERGRERECGEGKHLRNYGNAFDVVYYANDSVQNTPPYP